MMRTGTLSLIALSLLACRNDKNNDTGNDLNPEIKVDFVVYEGDKQGNPSTIVDLTDPEEIKEFHR